MAAFRIAVLISGGGSNLQALLDTVHGRPLDGNGADSIEVVGVAASRPDAAGLERAGRAGVESAVFALADHPDRASRDTLLADWLEQRGVQLVVLAGFMELLGPEFIERFEGRILNVHPSLLPAFPGLRAIEQALEYGVKTGGVTVHLVDRGVDTGPIVLQEALELTYPARIGDIEERVHEIEHRLLPRAVRLLAQGRVRRDPDNPRLVLIDDDRH